MDSNHLIVYRGIDIYSLYSITISWSEPFSREGRYLRESFSANTRYFYLERQVWLKITRKRSLGRMFHGPPLQKDQSDLRVEVQWPTIAKDTALQTKGSRKKKLTFLAHASAKSLTPPQAFSGRPILCEFFCYMYM